MIRLKDKIFSIILVITSTLFILSASIYLPLNNRNYYYSQIDKLNVVEDLNDWLGEGYTKEDAIEAYDDVLDFIWKGKEFKTGKLAFSEEGKSHFEDCVGLFWFDFILFIVTSVILIISLLLVIFKVFKVVDFKGFSPLFYGGIFSLGIVTFLGIFAALDFDLLFNLFHKIAFPGKENWLFDPYLDQVILILPEDYFLSCAILIGVGLLSFSTLSIVYSIIKRKYIRKNEK